MADDIRRDDTNRHKEPEPRPYDPSRPTGLDNPRPTGDGDPTGRFEQRHIDPDREDAPKNPAE